MSEVALVTAGAPDVYLVEIPNQSYNALGYTECPRTIRNAWIDAPKARPQTRTAWPGSHKLNLATDCLWLAESRGQSETLAGG
jgi:hypothetical protein